MVIRLYAKYGIKILKVSNRIRQLRPAFHGREIARGMDMRTDAKLLIYVKIHSMVAISRTDGSARGLKIAPCAKIQGRQICPRREFSHMTSFSVFFSFRINRQIRKDKVQATDLYPVHVTSRVKDKPYTR